MDNRKLDQVEDGVALSGGFGGASADGTAQTLSVAPGTHPVPEAGGTLSVAPGTHPVPAADNEESA
jgi:hypothetical protein